MKYADIIKNIEPASHPLDNPAHLDPLIERIGDSKYVLLGEASHGTHEYYTWRREISKRLIEKKGFSFIAVEGDWPDCYKINRYIKGYEDSGSSARDVLMQFKRWPTWMWANWETASLADWLKQHNSHLASGHKIGFYGLDVYSLWESMDAIMEYIKKAGMDTLEAARSAIKCFEPFSKDEDGAEYAKATYLVPVSCREEVINLLKEIRAKSPSYSMDGEAKFNAEQNALVAVNAEKYYSTMIYAGSDSWNIRDRHMAETLNNLMKHHGKNAKAIIWEHNTHIGDARATDMAEDGMVNVGQLVREEHEEDGVVLVGFGSYTGTVIAGRKWGAPMQVMDMPDARTGSWEEFLHTASPANRLLIMNRIKYGRLYEERVDHRAIGVVYNPELERFGNYVPSFITSRYDAFLFIDKTRALHPMQMKVKGTEVPETYPFGM
jgi:erythromycin esterase-like protein